MAQAIADPEELERFAYSLQRFIDSLNDAVGYLNGAFASLGDTWQDEKRARFCAEYGIPFYDPATFLGVSCFLIFVAGVASLVPARRALRVDPMVSLRHE